MNAHRVTPANAFRAWAREDVEQTIARRFEQQVCQFPQRTAVRGANSALTYVELNEAANRLAHALRSVTSAPVDGVPTRVALLLNHDLPLITALVAVCKAENVCVILTPSHPEARLAGLLRDCGAEVLVTDTRHLLLARNLAQRGDGPVPGDGVAPAPIHVVNVDELVPALSRENPVAAVSSDSPAFIIYTSGSTGRPRGVVQTHRNVLHNIRRHTHGFHIHEEDRICLLAAPSSGQGMAVVLGALLNGATLCLCDLLETSITHLAAWLIAEKITIYISAATVFRHFARILQGEQFPHLRAIRLASEPVLPGDVEQYRKHFNRDCLFANTFSSTETGNMCQFFMNKESQLSGDVVPVGYPVEDLEILLWDENDQPVEPGAPGEIVVKSRYLSPGYWNAPEQTARVFHSVPGSEERIYRTRDMGRCNSDGRIEHLGRKDTQLKIRGFRVYPEEIKGHLCSHPAISDALVETRPDESGNPRLVAYLIADPRCQPSVRDLRRHLKERLPDHMVPSSFFFLEEFPRTPNGKVNRAALAELRSPENSESTAPPTTPIEKALAGVWAEVLNRDAVGIHDSFFDLGGDSLSVTQLLCRIEEVLRIDVPFTLLFEKPTIAELSAALEERKDSGPGAVIPPIVAISREQPPPLSFSQERTWRFSQTREGTLGYIVCNGYVLDGALDVDALQRSFNELVRRHETLRTTFAEAKGMPVQVIRPVAPVPLRVIDLKGNSRAEEEADWFWSEEARHPIDIERGPMLRIALICLDETRHWLLMTYHHINSDAWSRDNFLRELGVLYAAFSNGRPSPLPENTLQYADFAAWQRRFWNPDSEHYQAQLAFWKRQLANSPPSLRLPCQRATAPETTKVSDGIVRWSIPADLSNRLQTLGREEGATLFMTRLAAFAAQLRRLTGAEDIVIGSYMTNRSRPETQGMIGFFSNLLMFRVDLSGNPTFRQLLGRVAKMTLETTVNGDIPYEDLCAALRRENVCPPELQIIFGVRYGETSMRFGNLQVERMERRYETMPWGFQLSVDNKGDQSSGILLLDANRYEPATVAQVLSGFEALLAEVADCPNRPLFLR